MANSPEAQNNLFLIAFFTEIKSAVHMVDVCMYVSDQCKNEWMVGT